MILIHKDSGRPILKDEILFDKDGEPWIVTGWREPHKPSSTGRIFVDHAAHGDHREFFPQVFDAEFVVR
jgi:hypothetical protein